MSTQTNINRPYKGINSDVNKIDQPKGTYSFALNALLESKEGDSDIIGNAHSNEICAELPDGYTLIGKIYLSKGETALFLVNGDESLSEIGILDDACNYTTHVNTDLDFKLTHQIDGIYRLRRGCERNIYFVDGYNRPRIYNFDKPDDFKTSGGAWDSDKFSLIRTWDKVPIIDNIQISEDGVLLSGSYNFFIQYLDENLNPTEWLSETDTVIIYNDDPNSKAFQDVNGSTNKITDYQDFGPTSKSISFDISNIDTSFPFYRIGVAEATNGSGEVSKVLYSEEISTQRTNFTYTGDNFPTEGSLEELQAFTNVITSANHIEQIENRLILANVKGPQVNWCKLQRYASKIQSALVTERIVLNSVEAENNPKRGQFHTEKIGYMPGEIYSFGIVYLFKDGSTSPVYHIPGRNATQYVPQAFDGDGNRVQFPMSSDNQLENTLYLEDSDCLTEGYWGVDSQGESLVNTNVRHHRFPLRSEVSKPLLVKQGEFGTPSDVPINGLYLGATGTIAGGYTEDTITYVVNYEINSVAYQQQGTITVANYNPVVGVSDILIDTSTGTFSNITVQEIDPSTGSPAAPTSGLAYATNTGIADTITTVDDDSVYTSEIFGIRFFDIPIPTLEDTNGNQVTGYYIVRNERTNNVKTIVDSGVLCPMIVETGATTGEVKFVAHGHLIPNTTRVKTDTFALIHPEHRFDQKEYRNIDRLIQEGVFSPSGDSILAQRTLEDVQPGTSYDSSAHKRRERDTDGFSLHVLTRNNNLDYARRNIDFAADDEIEDIFYLDALSSNTITDIADERKSIFNVSSDNKIGIVQTSEERSLDDGLPYVIMKRNLSDPYATFSVLPYHRQTTSNLFIDGSSSVAVFNGDSYISSMRYTSSMFYDIRIRDRGRKSGLFNFIVGVLATIAGTVLTVLAGPVGLALIGFGVSQIAVGLKKDKIAKVYGDLYDQGLRDTVDDDDTNAVFSPNPPDDTIQWFFDILTNLWFESSANANWRVGSTIGITDFLDSPEGYDETQLLQYAVDKITVPDTENDDGRTYQGFARAEIYEINKDYRRRNKQKIHFPIGIEYDCCSKCIEEFPHRTHYSEQSFQEELSDNYRVFLPNNYRDIEGQTGHITDLFKIQNSLFFLTEEGLWSLPQNIQERVTNGIVSFLGTGEFFGIPPRLIVDDETGNSAGCEHKWSVIKTPYGVFYISERERKVYKFNGNNLVPISNRGLFSFFKENVPCLQDRDYLETNTKPYPYRNNPSNFYGTGFISVYDSRFERVIFSKKDFLFSGNDFSNDDYEICVEDGNVIIFNDISQTIQDRQTAGWTYVGIEDCRLKFEKASTQTITVQNEQLVSNTADIHVFFDTSGSFGGDPEDTVTDIENGSSGICLQSISNAIDAWIVNFGNTNPDWTGNVYKYTDTTEQWINYADRIGTETYSGVTADKDIIVISFCNEASPVYHANNMVTPILGPSSTFNDDYNNFVNNIYPNYNSFLGIHYPIVFGDGSSNCGGIGPGGEIPSTKAFLLHSIAALWGTEMTNADVASEFTGINPAFSTTEWNDLVSALQTSNPYPDDGLRNYGWVGKWDRYAMSDGSVISDVQFEADIQDLLDSAVSFEDVEVEVPITIYEYEDGETIADPSMLNNSWTLSYALKKESWASFHSYLPYFYINTPERFYSAIHDNQNIWRHNREHHYQNYYNTRGDFIVEVVSVSNPLVTRFWDYIRLITEAKRYDNTLEDSVDVRLETFNKAILYNTTQCSGLLTLNPKDALAPYLGQQANYMYAQIRQPNFNNIWIDRNEKDWTFNDIRDIRTDYSLPIFIKNLNTIQSDYFIDKVLNTSSTDFNKNWTQLELFRDKYLVLRLIFDRFDDVKLLFNYSVEHEQTSHR